MDKGFYNTHTISDSDDSVIIEDHKTNISLSKNDFFMLPEEPAFFHEVIQRVWFLYYLVVDYSLLNLKLWQFYILHNGFVITCL